MTKELASDTKDNKIRVIRVDKDGSYEVMLLKEYNLPMIKAYEVIKKQTYYEEKKALNYFYYLKKYM